MTDVYDEDNWEITDDADMFYERTGLISRFEELLSMGFARDDYSGFFWGGQVDVLLDFCKKNPCYHVITISASGRYENSYIPGKKLYYLADGDQTPNLILDLFLHKSSAEFAKEGLTKAFSIILDRH
jgi:hypothetical protein